MEQAPPAKKARTDGNLDAVDKSILLAAQDHEKWIAERRKNWPSRRRVAEKTAEDALKPRVQVSADPAEKSENSQNTGGEGNSRKVLCRYFLRGRCNAGAKCRFSHDRPTRPSRPAHERVYKRFEPPTKAPLFVKLLQTDLDSEDELFIQFINYLHAKKILRSSQLPQETSAENDKSETRQENETISEA